MAPECITDSGTFSWISYFCFIFLYFIFIESCSFFNQETKQEWVWVREEEGRNWEEQREGKLYSDDIAWENNMCLIKGEKYRSKNNYLLHCWVQQKHEGINTNVYNAVEQHNHFVTYCKIIFIFQWTLEKCWEACLTIQELISKYTIFNFPYACGSWTIFHIITYASKMIKILSNLVLW